VRVFGRMSGRLCQRLQSPLYSQVFPPLTPLQFDASVMGTKGSANYSDSATEEEEIYSGARSVTGYSNVDQRSIEPNIPSIHIFIRDLCYSYYGTLAGSY
jgi:hypothetical protein